MQGAGLNNSRRIGRRLAALAAAILVASLGSSAWCSKAHAQPENARVVRTRDGVEFAILRNLRETAVAQQVAGFPGELERAYSDGLTPPLQLFITRDESQRRGSLPPPSKAIARDYSAGFVAGIRSAMKLAEIDAVAPGTYDPEHGAFSILLKTRAASRAGQLLQQSDSSESWQQFVRGAGDPTQLRCVLGQLLTGATTASEPQLRAHYAAAANTCGWTVDRVAQYVAEVGPSLFSAVESSIASVAFFTRSALVQVFVVAPNARAEDVRSTAALIVSSSRISAEAKLEVSIFNELENMSAFTVGRLLGAIVGPFFAVVLIGGFVAWLLTRAGVTPTLAGPVACALLVLVSALGAVWSADFSIFTICQLVSYLLASVLAFRPMIKWLSARQGSRAA